MSLLCALCVLYCRQNECGFEQCNGKYKFGGVKGSYAYVYIAGGDTTAASASGDLCSVGVHCHPCMVSLLSVCLQLRSLVFRNIVRDSHDALE